MMFRVCQDQVEHQYSYVISGLRHDRLRSGVRLRLRLLMEGTK